jgi:hypothetical protein
VHSLDTDDGELPGVQLSAVDEPGGEGHAE